MYEDAGYYDYMQDQEILREKQQDKLLTDARNARNLKTIQEYVNLTEAEKNALRKDRSGKMRQYSDAVSAYTGGKHKDIDFFVRNDPEFRKTIYGPFKDKGMESQQKVSKTAPQTPPAKPMAKDPAKKVEPAKPAATDAEKARKERQARIKKAEETHVYDAQYIKDKQEEEAENSGKTIAQVAHENGAGESSSGSSSSGESSSGGASNGSTATPQSRSKALYETQALLEMAQASPDPYIRMQAASAARDQFNSYLGQKDVERYGVAGAQQIQQAAMPYNAAANPLGYQAAPGSFLAPGPAAQVAANMARQQAEQNYTESQRLQQLYSQGNAPDFLKPGTAANRSFQMLSPEQQVAAIRANNTQATPFNRQTPNSPQNYAELWRKAGFKPNEVPATPAARFAPGYKWVPPGAPPGGPVPSPLPPLPPTPVAPAIPQNPYGMTPMVANMMTTAPQMPLFPPMIPPTGAY